MPRLGSKKSRNGCVQCKTRRVKCDEDRPCGACRRYRVECSLLGSQRDSESESPRTRISPRQREGSGTAPPPPNRSYVSPYSSPGGLILANGPSAGPEGIVTSQWMLDLELMHHYTAHAYLTLPGVEYTRQIWGYAVPQEGFKFPYLMHSILAFSANHLAYINPSKASHFRLLSSTHQTAAVTSLNQALADIGPANCHAIFVGASLTVMNAFADARIYSLDVLVETFQLIRGMNYVLEKVTPMLEKGPFAPIIRPCKEPPKPSPLLSAYLVEVQSSCYSTTEDPTPSERARIKASEALRRGLQYSLETSPHPALRASMIWPISIESEFMEMLKTRKDPEVRALFKLYCRLLEFAATDFWFFVGWRGISEQL
ncbi:Nn.00g004060.m01.CDS01 [Neocucurbitaria sp. VM-36]